MSLYKLWLYQRVLGAFVALMAVAVGAIGAMSGWSPVAIAASVAAWGTSAFALLYPFDAAPEQPDAGRSPVAP